MQSTATAALASLRPWVGAAAAVQPARPNQLFVPRTDSWNTSWTAGVNVTWQLFDGGKAHADQAAALAQADAIKSRLDDFDAVVRLEIRQRLLDLDSDRAAIAASDEAVAAATEALRVLGERFRAGVATSTDTLDGQIALLEAQLERTRLSAALRVAEARFRRALGAL
jgi:OMF family outer membrane factor